MKRLIGLLSVILLLGVSVVLFSFRSGSAYSPKQLMEPATLARILRDPTASKPVILNVGTMKLIKGAIPAGPTSTDDGMISFKSQLVRYKKSEPIVIYCGCCAMEHCPNIGPAMEYLQDQGFTNAKI